jgi:hypothetical protein
VAHLLLIFVLQLFPYLNGIGNPVDPVELTFNLRIPLAILRVF